MSELTVYGDHWWVKLGRYLRGDPLWNFPLVPDDSPEAEEIRKREQELFKVCTESKKIPDFGIEDSAKERDLNCRPLSWDEYIGQEEVKEMLKVLIAAAKKRNEPLEHLLFYAPPGCGKTSLAYVIANELGIPCKVTVGSMLTKPKDLYETIDALPKTRRGPGAILVIDEIHSLGSRSHAQIAEQFYSIMDDFEFHYLDEASGKSYRIKTPRFTCIGMTTSRDKMDQAFLSRFIDFRLKDYAIDELEVMIKRMLNKLSGNQLLFEGTAWDAPSEAARSIAKRCRGIPRQALIYTKLCRALAEIKNTARISLDTVNEIMAKKQVDEVGFRGEERAVINFLVNVARDRTAGADAIARSLGFRPAEYVENIEPFLLKEGYIIRTPRGRQATGKAVEYAEIHRVGRGAQ